MLTYGNPPDPVTRSANDDVRTSNYDRITLD